MPQTPRVSVPQQFLDDTLQFVEVGSFALKRACDEVAVHRTAQQKAAALRGPLLDVLVRGGLVAPRAKQAAEAMLASHAETLQLLKAACDVIGELHGKLEKQARSLGGPDASQPDAAPVHASLTSPFVGQPTSEKTASDLALLKILEPASR